MAIPATLQHGADFRPERVRDQHGHVWMVQAVLEQWQHPASAGETLGRPECIARWVLRVWGPLPREPWHQGGVHDDGRAVRGPAGLVDRAGG